MSTRIKNFTFLLFSFCTFVGQSLLGASEPSACASQSLENTKVSGRAAKITFPDGRFIIVVGHIHGSRQIYEIMDKIQSGELSNMSDESFNNYLNKILETNSKKHEGLLTKKQRRKVIWDYKEKHQVDVSSFINPEIGLDIEETSVLGQAKQDYEFLNQLLPSLHWKDRIDFVGYEGSPQTWAFNFPQYHYAHKTLLNEFYIRKKRGKVTLTHDQLWEVLLSSSNGNAYAFIERPQLNIIVPMIGTESLIAGQEHSQVSPITAIAVVPGQS